jgi:small-conductance mechanosensitive channel
VSHPYIEGTMQDWLSRGAELVQSFRPFLVDLLTAAALLLLGSILGRFLETGTRRAAQAMLDRVGRRGVGSAAVGAAELAKSVSVLGGRFVYWLIFLLFAAAAIEVLGLPVVSGAVRQLTSYLPSAITALAILFVGVVIASLAGGAAAAAAASGGVRYAGAVGRVVQGGLLVLAILIGLEQIGVHGELVVVLLAVMLGTVLGGAALAFGLGARTAVSNIVAAYYVAQTYRVGQTVRVGDVEGRIIRTTSTAVVLDTKRGQVQVPARLFSEQPTVLVAESG